MQVGVIKERRAGELRVAITPETVKKFVGMGLSVVIETKAGLTAAITDKSYQEAGANIVKTPDEALKNADIVLKVRKPLSSEGSGKNTEDEVKIMKAGAVLICLMEPYSSQELIKNLADRNITTFSMELIPRITRAQTMDTLSSQSNLAGYKAVLEAAHVFGRAFPMMMTAAGTVPPAKCLVMGAGVAGLQAIATARRLGAVVSASDVRPAAKENVESLGASFVAVEDEEFQQAETAGGYAKVMSDEYKQKQAELMASTVAKQDIVICTALIPGRPAPVLVSAEMVKTMRPGSVLVDLAAEQGGNCPLSVPDKTIIKNGVSIIGQTNLASAVAIDASILFAKNLLSFASLMINQEDNQLAIDIADEIIKESLLTKNGEVIQTFT
ncbi:Re/Si-specific NAD(P)(+) transhydrogenase subunit alpha [Rhodospirillaceae bacterium]|jgi:H+-translocating NAD(P) transhydrogenase subunit alpha|nr:Re/Si-specific NAD(P)(+) transhydrogenase subunit alpha [Rhodospirillaceae bacterium]MBT6306189.1 Re/Si-specific NAD(P)(+) transhydrogenase subunit alpha [Rhodospirillaceae bacterium]MBT7730860.1 Re/Si-specific NAD(P)(+) transhydrogenase subunit alpha [Rhodospirillaceae bacterium]MDC0997798.1 Re/Si-specific NAD(P)(+) transhydrogenase subunit alpha [Alphaproteobacteria bacterium]MDC1441954.1 Re/Si-specific NAD(P)(+) transhydrogenase subunit alpha [Rhodospirillaceae bacterium]